jgi:O-methyltransferase involved in polyketide biosynthesis
VTDDLSPEIDAGVPHSARIWNYWLGGRDNYPVDREAGDQYREAFPDIVTVARASRHFLTRSIRYLAGEAGIRQFLDVGSGLPTVDNTHEVAQRVAPQSRIVYVDHDPLVLTHARALLTSAPEGITDYIDSDLRRPEEILEAAAKTLDFGRPIALVLSGIMGHVPDAEEARSIVRRLLAALPSGSCLSLNDGITVAEDTSYEEAQEEYNDSGAIPYVLRTPEEIARFFDGLELIEPGLVHAQLWRPETTLPDGSAPVGQIAGVGYKRRGSTSPK